MPGDLVRTLRERGHDVGWVRVENPGMSDEQVMERAFRENRVLLTFDKDFGDLVFQRKTANVPGIVLFRVAPTSPGVLARLVPVILESKDDWHGHFSVVEQDRVRMTPIPSSNS